MVEIKVDDDRCQRCKQDMGGDGRTLWMACFYQMNELGLPFDEREIIGKVGLKVGEEELATSKIKVPKFQIPEDSKENGHRFFTLRVCKDCRAEWMGAIKQWFETPMTISKSTGTGVYIRKNGATVEATPEEVAELERRNGVAFRIVKDDPEEKKP